MLYNIALISATHQHESAIGIHVSLALWPPSHLPHLSQSASSSSLGHTSHSHWLSILHVVSICFHATVSIHPTLSFLHCVHKAFLYVYVFIASLQIASSVPSLLIPYFALIYDICFSDLLPFVIVDSSSSTLSELTQTVPFYG